MRLWPLWLLPFCALLSGCPGRHARPDTFDDDPQRLLAAARANAKAITSLSGQLKLEVWRGAERVKLRQLVALPH